MIVDYWKGMKEKEREKEKVGLVFYRLLGQLF
jgi:hypothetical protein